LLVPSAHRAGHTGLGRYHDPAFPMALSLAELLPGDEPRTPVGHVPYGRGALGDPDDQVAMARRQSGFRDTHREGRRMKAGGTISARSETQGRYRGGERPDSRKTPQRHSTRQMRILPHAIIGPWKIVTLVPRSSPSGGCLIS
jgi:hypothetical protein